MRQGDEYTTRDCEMKRELKLASYRAQLFTADANTELTEIFVHGDGAIKTVHCPFRR